MSKLDFTDVGVIVVGDVMLDAYIYGRVDRLSPEAPVPVVAVNKQTHVLGGAGNVALNLARLGCTTYLMGVAGRDSASKWLNVLLNKHNIRNGVLQCETHLTTKKTRVIGNERHQLIRYDEEEMWDWSGASEYYDSIIDRIRNLLPFSKVVVISDYNKGFLSTSLVADIIDVSRNRGVPVIADPPYKASWKGYHGCYAITPNLLELEAECDFRFKKPLELEEIFNVCSKILKDLSLEAVIATLGKEGIALQALDRDEFSYWAAEAKEVYDVSGAGDTVIATLAACIGKGIPLSRSVEIANTAAGIVVGKVGTKPITIHELEEALNGECNSR